MTGLLLIGVIAVWFVIVRWLVRKVESVLPKPPWRKVTQIVLFAVLLPLPLIDEIVGGWQFARLCKAHDTLQLDREKARGKTVYFAGIEDFRIDGFWIPVTQRPKHFLDATTNEPILSYERFLATGGVLIRSLGISEGNVPLTFPSYCEPGGLVQYNDLFKELGIKLIERKDTPKGETK